MASARNGLHRFLVLWLCSRCSALYIGQPLANREDFVTVDKIEAVCTEWYPDSARVPRVFPNSRVAVRLRGTGLLPNRTKIAFTSESLENGQECHSQLFVARQLRVRADSNGDVVVQGVIPAATSQDLLYLCTRNRGRWRHQGRAVRLMYATTPTRHAGPLRMRRNLGPGRRSTDRNVTGPKRNQSKSSLDGGETAQVLGLRAFGERVATLDSGMTQVPAGTAVELQLFGNGFTNQSSFAFTHEAAPRGSACDEVPTVAVAHATKVGGGKASVLVSLPGASIRYYVCIKAPFSEDVKWVHQGDEPWVTLVTQGRLMPVWVQAIILAALLLLSGLFSGLNLGLMALDKTELRVIESCGTPSERKWAKVIAPLRNHGNYLLCSLLLGNVLVNSTLTILLDDLTSGVVAVVGSTISIVIFGEIIPQAICSRHGLQIGARTLFITKVFMALTLPLSWPISKILDWVLGEEIGHVYDREKLIEYIRLTKDYNMLETEEVDIISGALELKKKTANEAMTRMDDVFMLPVTAVLDFETVSQIIGQGYTRIPVFEGDRNNVVGLLNIKDLAFVDPEDEIPLRTLCEFYNHPLTFVFEDETLVNLLNEFKKGQSHMAFVRRVNTEGDGDPFYELLGLVTLEDVIEEILQSEIIDETDVLMDNRRKLKRKEAQVRQDFSDFAKLGYGRQGKHIIAPQLALATFQYLATSVEPFKKNLISESVLRRLMLQNIFISIKMHSRDDPVIYVAGQPADYFVLVLEGRVSVTVGREKLLFETGPFSTFGIPAIYRYTETSEGAAAQNLAAGEPSSWPVPEEPFVPDYSVQAVADTVYMRVHRSVYLAALKASRLDRPATRTDLEVDHMLLSSAPEQPGDRSPLLGDSS
ncbi:unextended protein-like [Amblyomma americanum]